MASWNNSASFELNSTMKWTFDDDVPDNIPVWVLVEERCCQPLQPPSVFRVIYDTSREEERKRFQFLDSIDYRHCSDKRSIDYLDGNQWYIVGWRRLTDHGGTWDSFMQEQYNIVDASDWTDARNDTKLMA